MGPGGVGLGDAFRALPGEAAMDDDVGSAAAGSTDVLAQADKAFRRQARRLGARPRYAGGIGAEIHEVEFVEGHVPGAGVVQQIGPQVLEERPIDEGIIVAGGAARRPCGHRQPASVGGVPQTQAQAFLPQAREEPIGSLGPELGMEMLEAARRVEPEGVEVEDVRLQAEAIAPTQHAIQGALGEGGTQLDAVPQFVVEAPGGIDGERSGRHVIKHKLRILAWISRLCEQSSYL